MSVFPKLLDDFHAAILTGDAAPAAKSLKHHPRLEPHEQLAIYIDGYRLRLTEAIRSDYPALLACLGDESFDKLALSYIESNPPAEYNLDHYPYAFAAFVREQQDDQLATDLAALEGAIAEIFTMPESDPLEASALAALTPEAFGSLTLSARAASRLLSFDYPVNDWLLAQRAGTVPASAEKNPTFLYIHRHQNNVQRTPVSEEAYMLLERLFKGMPIGEALDIPQAEIIAANLQAWFAEWMEKGFFRTVMA
jgi:hypothetical protein